MKHKERFLTIALYLFVCASMYLSPVQRIADSKFSMLVSYSLIDSGRFDVGAYLKEYVHSFHKFTKPSSERTGIPYQLKLIDGRLYYLFPPGTSVLSAPFVYIVQFFGLKPVDDSGNYSEEGDARIQKILSALLSGIFALFLYQTARQLMSIEKSLMLCFISVFGTQLWSTASRGMQSHIWGLVLVSAIAYMVTRAQCTENYSPNPLVLGTIATWSYFVRPTFATTILALGFFLFFKRRRLLLPFVAVCFVWFLLFVWYSMANFNRPLPTYFSGEHFGFNRFPEALTGDLISPSRGLLIYVPLVLIAVYNAIRFRKQISEKGLLRMAVAICMMHLFVISLFKLWWGGHSYGARFWTDALPWLFVIGMLGIRARSKILSARPSLRSAYPVVVTLIVCISIFMNAQGALCERVWKWDAHPDIDAHPERLWQWSEPQFLACFEKPGAISKTHKAYKIRTLHRLG